MHCVLDAQCLFYSLTCTVYWILNVYPRESFLHFHLHDLFLKKNLQSFFFQIFCHYVSIICLVYINVSIQKILQVYYIGNIVVILLCYNLHHYYCILHYTYIQRRLANQYVKPSNYSLLGIRTFCSQNSFLPLPPAAGFLFAFPKWILLLPPTSPSPPVVQPSRPTIYKLLLVVSFLHNNSLHLQRMSLTPARKFLSFLCTLWEHKLQLSLLYQIPTKLFR